MRYASQCELLIYMLNLQVVELNSRILTPLLTHEPVTELSDLFDFLYFFLQTDHFS
jgi:hypothetical protein